MAIAKESRYLICVGCGKNARQTGGRTGWIMCDKCQRLLCSGCYRSKEKQSSFCTAHTPWGRWLRGSSVSGKNTIFR